VVNPVGAAIDKPRYSIPFFMHPNPDFLIETLPTCISPDRPNQYPQAITANDYLLQRLAEIGLLKKPQ
jgi:isopenicillin N synthase-like dioxygenase